MSTRTPTRSTPPAPGPEPDRLANRSAVARRRASGRTLILVGAVLAVALMLAVPVRSWVTQRAELERLHAEMAATQARVDALAAQKQRWEDPRFVTAQARQRLNMAKPGESALIVVAPEDRPELQAQEPTSTSGYDKLWEATRSIAGTQRVAEPAGDEGG